MAERSLEAQSGKLGEWVVESFVSSLRLRRQRDIASSPKRLARLLVPFEHVLDGLGELI